MAICRCVYTVLANQIRNLGLTHFLCAMVNESGLSHKTERELAKLKNPPMALAFAAGKLRNQAFELVECGYGHLAAEIESKCSTRLNKQIISGLLLEVWNKRAARPITICIPLEYLLQFYRENYRGVPVPNVEVAQERIGGRYHYQSPSCFVRASIAS